MLKWVKIEKLAVETGYTVKALRRKIESGVFIEGVIWRKSPDGRIHIHVKNYEKWVEGHQIQAA